MRRKWLKLFAMLLTLTLVAAACDTDEDEEGTEETEETEAEGTTAPPKKVDNLLIGQIWAESGPLAPLGPPVSEGLNLAIEDINAAGGVLGKDVDVLKGDEAGDAAKVRDAAQRLLSEGAQVIVGAMSSGMTDEIIQTLFENEIPQCSPSNTSPQFAAQENATFYFRTVPPDNAVAPVIADRVAEDGHASVAVVARADDYGKPLADLVESEAEKVGLEVTQKVTYDPDASTFDSEVDKITGDEPDAVVLISFAEGAGLIKGLLEAGMTPDQFYGADGIFDPTLPGAVDPDEKAIIDGMSVIGAAGTAEFLERIAPITENNLIYSGQAYDCTVLMALAVETVGNLEDGAAIVEAAIQATKDGKKCSTFEECKGLIADGEDIDYDGAGGALELDETGDPTEVTYSIATFQDEGTLTAVDSKDVDVTELAG